MNIGKHLFLCSERLRLANMSERTIQIYGKHLQDFLTYFKDQATKPSEINEQKIVEYLKESGSTAILRQRIGALKFFYVYVVKQPLKFKYIPFPKREQRKPIPLTQGEIQRLLDAVPNKKHKAILLVIYSCGLRISEVLNLRLKDIDRGNNVIWIVQSKGYKDRHTPLDKSVLRYLEKYYHDYYPKEYLFENPNGGKYSAASVRTFLKRYCRKAGIRPIHPHLLRHCMATHTIEQGTDISILQEVLGHRNINTTRKYTYISTRVIGNTPSPIQTIRI